MNEPTPHKCKKAALLKEFFDLLFSYKLPFDRYAFDF